MSNPGVIILDGTCMKGREINGPRLQIDDNIGESIHIHLRDLRLDFTIKDFLILAEGIKNALNNLLCHTNINLDMLDPYFLREIEEHLQHITEIKIRKFFLDDLKCIEYNPKRLTGRKMCKIIDIMEFKHLSGEHGDSSNIKQNGRSEYEISSLDLLRRSVKKNGYPYDNKYIVLLGNQLVIRDGKKRAALLRYLYGNIEIPILILNFKRGYKRYKNANQANIKSFLKYYLKLVIPLKIRSHLLNVIRKIHTSGILQNYWQGKR